MPDSPSALPATDEKAENSFLGLSTSLEPCYFCPSEAQIANHGEALRVDGMGSLRRLG